MSPPRVGGAFPLFFSVTGYNPSLKTLNDGTFSPLLNPNQICRGDNISSRDGVLQKVQKKLYIVHVLFYKTGLLYK